MTSPFDYVNSVSFTKKDLMTDSGNDALAEKLYNPFITNMALSYHADTIEYSNWMNGAYHLDNKLQYHFYLNIVRPKKRFAKWVKKETNNDVEVVKEYYGYNHEKAQAALRILTPDQIQHIKEKLEKGGP